MNENSKLEFEQYLSYLSRYASPPNTKHSSSRSPSLTQSNNNKNDENNVQNEQLIDISQACQSCGRSAPNQTYVHEFTTNQFLYNLYKSKESECSSCSRQLVQLKHEANIQKQAESMAPPSPLSFRSTTTTTSNMGKLSAFKPYHPNKQLHNKSFESSSSSPSFLNVNSRLLPVLNSQYKEEEEEDEKHIDISSKIRKNLVTIHTDLIMTNSEEAKQLKAEIPDKKSFLPKEKKSNSNEEENESSVNRKKLIHNEVEIKNKNNLNESLQKQPQKQKTKMSDDYVYSFKKLISPPPPPTTTTTTTKANKLPSQSNNNNDERIYTFKRVMPKQVSRALTRQATDNLRTNKIPNQPVVVVPFKNIKDLEQAKQRRHRRKSETQNVLSSDGDERNSLTFSSSSFQSSNDEDDDDDEDNEFEFEFKPLSKKETSSQPPTSKPTDIDEHIYESLSYMGSTSELDETNGGAGEIREEKGEFNKERERVETNLDVPTDKITKENAEKEEETSLLYATINSPIQKDIYEQQITSTLAPNTGYTYAIKDLLTKQRKIQRNENENEPPLKPPRSSSNNLSGNSSPAQSLKNQSPYVTLIGAKHIPTTLNISQRSQSPAGVSNKSGFSTLTQSLLDERLRRSRQSMNNTQESKKQVEKGEEESIPELDLLNEIIDEQSKPFEYKRNTIEENRTKSPNVSRNDSILLNKILFGGAGIERPKPNDKMFYTEPKTKSTSATSSVTNVGESHDDVTERTLSDADRFLKSLKEKRQMLNKDYSHDYDDNDDAKMTSSNDGQAPSDEILALHYKFKKENSIARNSSSRYVNEEQLYKIDKVVEESEEDDNNNKIKSYYVNTNDENNETYERNRRERNMENVDNFERFLLNVPSVDNDDYDDDDDQSFSVSSRTQNATFLSTPPISYKRHSDVNSGSAKKSSSIKEKSKKSKLKKIFKFK